MAKNSMKGSSFVNEQRRGSEFTANEQWAAGIVENRAPSSEKRLEALYNTIDKLSQQTGYKLQPAQEAQVVQSFENSFSSLPSNQQNGANIEDYARDFLGKNIEQFKERAEALKHETAFKYNNGIDFK